MFTLISDNMPILYVNMSSINELVGAGIRALATTSIPFCELATKM